MRSPCNKMMTCTLTVGLLATMDITAAPLSDAVLDETVAGASLSSDEADSRQPTIVVADDSAVHAAFSRRVSLSDATQSKAAALNVVNGAQADVANAVNVATGDAQDIASQQTNHISQSEVHVGNAQWIERSGINKNTFSQQRSKSDSQSGFNSRTDRTFRTHTQRSVVDDFNANIPEYNPFQNTQVHFATPKLDPVNVPKFDFSLTVDGTGLKGSIGPVAFTAPQLDLGTIALAGRDITVTGGFVDLGSLDLGTVKLYGCLEDDCTKFLDYHIGEIKGPHIDFGSNQTLVLKDANPFKDVHVNAGGGVSAAGRGHVEASLGRVQAGATFGLKLPDLSADFDFTVLGKKIVSDKFGISIPEFTASITLIDASFGAAYNADFNGVLCVSVQNTNCDQMSHRELNEETRTDITHTSFNSSASGSSATTNRGNETLIVGAVMTGAEADLIAMSQGSAVIDVGSTVQLDARAQTGMRVVSAVNASGAMVGNALNVTATSMTTSSAASAAAMTQNNVLTQYQTRPRSRP